MRATILAFIFLFCVIHPSVGIGLARDSNDVVAIKYYKTSCTAVVIPKEQQIRRPVIFFPTITLEPTYIETENMFLRFWKKIKMVTSTAEDYRY